MGYAVLTLCGQERDEAEDDLSDAEKKKVLRGHKML